MSSSNDNGILSLVPGEHVGAGSNELPDPATVLAERMSATIDAGVAGRVRITYQRRFTKHHKMSHWYWAAVSAEAVNPPER
jgi:hypothetical protein